MTLFGSGLLFWIVVVAIGAYSVIGIIARRSPVLRLMALGRHLGVDVIVLQGLKNEPDRLWATVHAKALENFILLCHRTRTLATAIRGEEPDHYYVTARLETLIGEGNPTRPAIRQLKAILAVDLDTRGLAPQYRKDRGSLQWDLIVTEATLMGIEECRTMLKLNPA